MNEWLSRREALAAGGALSLAAAGAGGEGKSTAEPAGLGRAHLRVARPTDDLAAVVEFYRDGLGLQVLGEFQDHDGFDGVMLGHKGAAYHLEFTRKAGHRRAALRRRTTCWCSTCPTRLSGARAVARLEKAGHKAVKAFNPYWDKKGRTFADPDGYRVVLQNAAWGA